MRLDHTPQVACATQHVRLTAMGRRPRKVTQAAVVDREHTLSIDVDAEPDEGILPLVQHAGWRHLEDLGAPPLRLLERERP